MLNRAARYLLAEILPIISWEWFISGTNRVLSSVTNSVMGSATPFFPAVEEQHVKG